MAWCGCLDYPCCGHDAGMGPESAEEFLESLDPEEREFAESYMAPCPQCGEMRPKNDEPIRKYGMCWMCHQDPKRRNSPVAQANLAFFAQNNDALRQKVAELEAENARLRGEED